LLIPNIIEYAMPYARIAITLPKDLVAAADRRARELDRSRSRVIAEALRTYLATSHRAAPPAHVREAVTPAYGSDAIGSARRAQLERDLARSPAERLRIAEEAARTARTISRGRGRRHQVIGFDSYDDFYEWKKSQRA
jgi:ribbon-helix-helix CopG family protein